MKNKLSELFKAAARESCPPVPSEFEADVLRALRARPGGEPLPLFRQLDAFSPRIAIAAAAVIVCCLILQTTGMTFGESSLSDQFTELSEQWFFAVN